MRSILIKPRLHLPLKANLHKSFLFSNENSRQICETWSTQKIYERGIWEEGIRKNKSSNVVMFSDVEFSILCLRLKTLFMF